MVKENYTKLPNEILEALTRIKLTSYEIRYILVVLRKTYGWNKPGGDYIANSQFVRATGIKKQHISRTKKKVIEKKIITKNGRKLAFNTNCEEWILPKGVTVTKPGYTVTQGGNSVTQDGGHKEHLPKETIQRKDNSSSYKELVDAYKRGNRKCKPYFWGNEMRWKEGEGKWYVLKDGEWLNFAGQESEIEWK